MLVRLACDEAEVKFRPAPPTATMDHTGFHKEKDMLACRQRLMLLIAKGGFCLYLNEIAAFSTRASRSSGRC